MAKPYATKKSSTTNGGVTTTTNNGGVSAVMENFPVSPSHRKNNIGRSIYWTPEEQSLIKEVLTNKHASCNLVKLYAEIVLKLEEKKTLNDVALRHRWLTEKTYQEAKQSFHATNHSNRLHDARLSTLMESDECIDDDVSYKVAAVIGDAESERNDQALNRISSNGSAFKEKDPYQQLKPSSHATNHSKGLHHAKLSTYVDSDEDIDDKISYKAIGGSAVRLLDQNEQAMNQISANVLSRDDNLVTITYKKLHGNSNLICQLIKNIDELMKESFIDMPEMEQAARQRYNCSIIERLKMGW